MKTLFTSALSILCFSVLASPPQDNLVQNGSFESMDSTFMPFSNIRLNPTGWTVNGFNVYFGGGIDIVRPGSGPYWEPADGTTSISLNYASKGAVSQQIATTAGLQYELAFSMAAEIYGGPALRTMDVLWNGEVIASPSFTYNGQTAETMGWVELTYNVVGTGNDTLTFTSTTEGNYGPTLDKVSLLPVPEPSSLALIALGGLTIFGFRRKQS